MLARGVRPWWLPLLGIVCFFGGLWTFLYGFGGNVIILAVGFAVLTLGVWLLMTALNAPHPGAPDR